MEPADTGDGRAPRKARGRGEESHGARVALYTDQAFLAEGLGFAFRSRSGFHLAASCACLSDAVAFVRDHGADILLLDLTEEVTVAALHAVRRIDPRCRMVLWTSSITQELAYQAMEAGVRGILRKSTPPERFLNALEAVREGDLWFEREVLQSLIGAKRTALTNREGQLVNLLSQGLKNKEIAWTLQISEGTVKVYLSRLFKKLGVSDRFELALYGLRNMQNGFANRPDRHSAAAPDPARNGVMALHSILIEAEEERETPALVNRQ